MRIGILGAGGVGATVAGAIDKSGEELILIARGETKQKVLERGWILESERLGNHVIRPALVSDDPQEIGVLDVLILACKSFAVKEVCAQYKDVVGPETLVIPLQNGFVTAKQAEEALHRGIIAHGFIYCLSQIVEKGHVSNVGTLLRAGFGFPDGRKNEKAERLAKVLNDGGLPTEYTPEVLRLVWQKYMMICGNSCVFLYYDMTVGGIMESQERLDFLRGTYADLERLANTEGVILPEGIKEKYVEEFQEMPADASSSLYRDLKGGIVPNELEQIIGSAVKLAAEKGIEIPYVAMAYEKTKERFCK